MAAAARCTPTFGRTMRLVMVAMIAGCCSAISRPEAQTFIPGAAVKVSGADSVLADALVSGRATTGWTPTSSLVLCGTSVGYTNQPPEQGQGAVRGLTGESSQAANPTSASASLGTPKLDAGSNQFVAFLGIQGAGGGACARGDRHSWARGRLTAANARGPYVAHSPRGLRAA